MRTVTHNNAGDFYYIDDHTHRSVTSIWKKFITYADNQQDKRLWWMTLGILGHGTIFTIITLGVVTLLGNVFALYIIACCAMVISVVVNLAALPTRYIIPIFFLSLLVDLGVIVTAVLLYIQ
ncbi:MAG TPA: hypothetical protein VK559_02795 [Ferruginibacter sp.]|nr:hypothetical protein [Ferruginibacter sp.]